MAQDWFESNAPQERQSPTLSPYAKPGPYITKLNPADETRFQSWVKENKIPFDPGPTADYDMRGFWKSGGSRAPNGHFPDPYKTPYHKTFSNESRYATPDAPRWDGDRLIDKNGTLIADESKPAEQGDGDWFTKNAPASGPGRGGRMPAGSPTAEAPDPKDSSFMGRFAGGVDQLTNLGGNRPGQKLKGLHNAIVGGSEMASPFLLPAAVAAPAATAVGLAGSAAGGALARTGASMAGASEDVEDLAGDAGAAAGGAVGGRFGPQLVRGIGATVPKGIKTKFADFKRGWTGEKPVTPFQPNAPTAKRNMPKFTPGAETVSGEPGSRVGMKGAPALPAKEKPAAVTPFQPNRVNPNIAKKLRFTPGPPAGAGESYPAARRSGPLAAPKTAEVATPPKTASAGVYPSKPAPDEAASIASVMTKHGITRAEAATMTPTEWQLVASNAGLKSMPSAETIQMAVSRLEGGKPPLRVRRTQVGR